MDCKLTYDEPNNILFIEFIGAPKSSEEVNRVNNKILEEHVRIGKKTWAITDLSSLSAANPKLVSEFAKLNTPVSEKYELGEATYTTKSIQRLMVSIFNNISGSKVPVFKTKEDALDYILERQKSGEKKI